MLDLNALVVPGRMAEFVTLNVASAINNDGVVVGAGTIASGETHAFVATPILEPLVWGAKVKIVPTQGSPLEDFLVAYDGTNIYLQKDLSIDSSGNVSLTGSGMPLQTFSTITAEPNPTAVTAVDYTSSLGTYGFNKYIVEGATSTWNGKTGSASKGTTSTVRTVGLDDAAYSNGQWHYKINSVGLRDDLRVCRTYEVR